MTVTPHKGLSAIEDVMDEVVDPVVAEVEQQTAYVDDPIFWDVVSDMGYPQLSHEIKVHITVYTPAEE